MCGVACSLILINDAASSFIRIHVQRLGAWYTALNHKEETKEETKAAFLLLYRLAGVADFRGARQRGLY